MEAQETKTGRADRIKTFLKKRENRLLISLIFLFLGFYFLPFGKTGLTGAFRESILMLQEYAREHVLLCLVPAFFIAGAVKVFLRQKAITKYLGPDASKPLAYGVASVSGSILAVCSCTVLPLFKSIYRKGAGIGPAVAFLYSGPAINVLAVILTVKVLGIELGVARAVGAVLFSILIGLSMHLIYRKEDAARLTKASRFSDRGPKEEDRTLSQNGFVMLVMIAILVFLNWAPSGASLAVWDFLYRFKYLISGGLGLGLAWMLYRWFKDYELTAWLIATRDFAVQILPLLFSGVLIAGFLLGRPGHAALIPEHWIADLVGGNSLLANLSASVAGALMYFATLTEIPIMQGLLGAGMGHGPALALLLAGPSLSLPNLLVIRSVLGNSKTVTYTVLVVLYSTVVGFAYGSVF